MVARPCEKILVTAGSARLWNDRYQESFCCFLERLAEASSSALMSIEK